MGVPDFNESVRQRPLDSSMNGSAPLLSPQQQRLVQSAGFALYREMVTGSDSVPKWVWYEMITGIGGLLPGVLGVAFRSFTYPGLFSQCGNRPYIGRDVTIRNPSGITLGNRIYLDDGVTIDCRSGSSLHLEDHVAVGRGSILVCKGETIKVGAGSNIGTHVRIATQSSVSIGEGVLIAAYCYIGPGNHRRDPSSGSFIAGDMDIKGGVVIGSKAWIGARATILDGVTIGEGSVVGAHSLVREDVPPGVVVAGAPAKQIGRVSDCE